MEEKKSWSLLSKLGLIAVGAVVLLITVVLPAEYGVDPTGFGRLTGISALSEPELAAGQDFGQTLAVWGVGPGPHVVLPFWGSRTLRDSFSMIPDVYSSPITYIDEVAVRNSLRGLDVVDLRADLIDAESLVIGDRYTFLRDIYWQQRISQIANGEVVE